MFVQALFLRLRHSTCLRSSFAQAASRRPLHNNPQVGSVQRDLNYGPAPAQSLPYKCTTPKSCVLPPRGLFASRVESTFRVHTARQRPATHRLPDGHHTTLWPQNTRLRVEDIADIFCVYPKHTRTPIPGHILHQAAKSLAKVVTQCPPSNRSIQIHKPRHTS